jgi:ribosomal protein S18 acetylase RimI-like enzyme
VSLRPATGADLAFIRSLTGRPDYAPFLTDEDEEGLSVYLTTSAHRLLVWGDNQGFALFAQIGEPSGAVELRRLGLADAGRGQGQPFLRDLIDYAFRDLRAQRLWLDASSENPRAMASYVKAGFTLEGCQRQHWYRPALGRNVDLMLYGMLRGEWQALAARNPAP